jgi:hypothetical protein
MSSELGLLGLLAAWAVLQFVVLPRLGVST